MYEFTLKDSITLAFWMCSEPSAAMTCILDVQQNTLPIGSARRSAAHCAACSSACVFYVRFQWAIWMCIIKTAHPIRKVCCIQCNGPRILLHIEKALLCSRRSLHIETAHPKRKCNRPLNNFWYRLSLASAFVY